MSYVKLAADWIFIFIFANLLLECEVGSRLDIHIQI